MRPPLAGLAGAGVTPLDDMKNFKSSWTRSCSAELSDLAE